VGSLGIDITVAQLSGPLRKSELVIGTNLAEDTGGCAGNVARTIAKLGGNAKLIARVGADYYGDFAIRMLKNDGVDIRQIVTDTGARTGVSIVLVQNNGERSFIYVPGANYKLGLQDILPVLEKMMPGDIINFSDTFLLPLIDGIPTCNLLSRARELGIITSLDTSWDVEGRWIDLIGDYFPYLSYFFTNLDEAKQLFPGMRPSEIILEIARRGVKNVIIKMGARGVYVKEENTGPYRLSPRQKLAPVDTTGAGDSFVAASLTGIQGGLTIKDAFRFAISVAEKNIMVYGANTGIPKYNSFADASHHLS